MIIITLTLCLHLHSGFLYRLVKSKNHVELINNIRENLLPIRKHVFISGFFVMLTVRENLDLLSRFCRLNGNVDIDQY